MKISEVVSAAEFHAQEAQRILDDATGDPGVAAAQATLAQALAAVAVAKKFCQPE